MIPQDEPEMLVGVDFAGPSQASAQRKKIIAIMAIRSTSGEYEILPNDFNERLLTGTYPGWTAFELSEALIHRFQSRVVAFDFPFSIPYSLLKSADFSLCVGLNRPLNTWQTFNDFIAMNMDLDPPLSLEAFVGWRNKIFWKKRATDVLVNAQPALKDRFQVLFNMTLLGNCLLNKLSKSRQYKILPFSNEGRNEIIEIYPGYTMRALKRPDYKRDPGKAIKAILSHCKSKNIQIDVSPSIIHFCETYNSASGKGYDPDGSDALIALCTSILYREGWCREALNREDEFLRESEGAIWGPII
jgi:hypothetical protein